VGSRNPTQKQHRGVDVHLMAPAFFSSSCRHQQPAFSFRARSLSMVFVPGPFGHPFVGAGVPIAGRRPRDHRTCIKRRVLNQMPDFTDPEAGESLADWSCHGGSAWEPQNAGGLARRRRRLSLSAGADAVAYESARSGIITRSSSYSFRFFHMPHSVKRSVRAMSRMAFECSHPARIRAS